ncbi:MAG: homocysteine S-methyltransferase family protein [Terriglobales bacterium]
MRTPLRAVLASRRLLISDGGNGTELQKIGLEPGGCGESWNVLHPERVRTVHASYLNAGSEIITTNSFNGNAFALGRWDMPGRVREFAVAAARIARGVAGDNRYVMGSVGPCGGFLEPLGDITVGDLEASLREQIGGLLEGGVDAINFETYTALDELAVCLRVARQLNAPVVIVSLAYDCLSVGFRTMMGVSPAQAAAFAVEQGADAVGANCGTSVPPQQFHLLIREYRAATTLPLIAQPNGGTPRLEDDVIVYPTSPDEMADSLVKLAADAQIVGGCCGCGPEHIAAFVRKQQAASG